MYLESHMFALPTLVLWKILGRIKLVLSTPRNNTVRMKCQNRLFDWPKVQRKYLLK
jgi:hypothetical protein